MGRIKNIIGEKFNRLTVLELVEKPKDSKSRSAYWKCLCDCGNIRIVNTAALRTGSTKSCGCSRTEALIKNNKKYKKKYNTYDLSGEHGIGYTTKGEEFYFDLDDYDKIRNYCWRISNRGYVLCSIKVEGEKRKINLLFHRFILDCEDEKEVDHIGGINTRKDNRKNNLRICTHQKNMCNYTKPNNNTSGVTGVCFSNTPKKWQSYITYQGKRISLGYYKNKEDAIKARLKAEQKYFGEFSPQKHLYKKYGLEESTD